MHIQLGEFFQDMSFLFSPLEDQLIYVLKLLLFLFDILEPLKDLPNLHENIITFATFSDSSQSKICKRSNILIGMVFRMLSSLMI